MKRLNQKGVIAQVLILLILAAGLVVGIYLVKNPQVLSPKARAAWLTVKDTSGNPLPFNPSGIPQTTNRTVILNVYSLLGIRSSVSSPTVPHNVSVKIAESPTGLATAASIPFDEEPVVLTFSFSDPNPGQKFIWAEFLDSVGRTERRTAELELLPSSVSGPISPIPTSKPAPILSTVVDFTPPVGSKTPGGSGQVIVELLDYDKSTHNATFSLSGNFTGLISGNAYTVQICRIDGSCGIGGSNIIGANADGAATFIDVRISTSNPINNPINYVAIGSSDTSGVCWGRPLCVTGNYSIPNSISGHSSPTPVPTAAPPVGGPGGGGGGGGGGNRPTPTPAARVISSFAVGESLADPNMKFFQDYVPGVIIHYTFKDTTLGQKFIFIKFMDDKGEIVQINGQDYISSSIDLVKEETAPTPTPASQEEVIVGSASLSTDSTVTQRGGNWGNVAINLSLSGFSTPGRSIAGLFVRNQVGQCSINDCGYIGWTQIRSYGTNGSDTTPWTPPSSLSSGVHMFGVFALNADGTAGKLLAVSAANFSVSGGGIICPADVKQCSDGSYVGRDANNNCEFKPCPVSSSSCQANVTACSCGDTSKGRTDDPGKCYPECSGGWCNGGTCATCQP